jgi:short-subunit dehydrogenase
MKNLRGRKALVTGAASGIGLQIALELARHGVDLVLVDIDEARLADAAARVRAAGVEAVPLVCDLSRPADVRGCVRQALDPWGTLDILVNNAGVAYYGPTERMTPAQWDRLMQINLLTPMLLTRELLPTLLGRPEAHVLNVCSIAGLVAGRKLAAYAASKSGLVAFSESLRAEYASRGLGVTALCPGLVRTGIFAAAGTGTPGKAVREPAWWLSVSPEAVARAAVRAVRRNRGLVLVSAMARALWLLRRVAPGLPGFLSGLSRKRWRAKVAVPAAEVRRAG